MYTPTRARTMQEALEGLTDGTHVSLPTLIDALRTVTILDIERQRAEDTQRRGAMSWSIDRAPRIDQHKVVPGTSRTFTFGEALPVINAAFPGMDLDMPRHLFGYTFGSDRDTARAQNLDKVLTDEFVLHCALILKAGWDVNDHGWKWWTNGQQVALFTAAEWVARWDLTSLTACVVARLTENELLEIILSEELPDPDAISMLVALTHPNGIA